MRLKGADARRFVPEVKGQRRVTYSLGGMRSGASFIDWRDVYVKTKRHAPMRIDYIPCEQCKRNIDLHRGAGVTHVAGRALCSTCAEAT